MESETDSSQVKQQSKMYMPDKSKNVAPSKLNSLLSFDINSNPYNQIAMDAKLLQAQSQFVAAGAAARREVGTVQLGLT